MQVVARAAVLAEDGGAGYQGLLVLGGRAAGKGICKGICLGPLINAGWVQSCWAQVNKYRLLSFVALCWQYDITINRIRVKIV